jgi:N12 class adenine-specific DNA methylase/predicted RNA methylase
MESMNEKLSFIAKKIVSFYKKKPTENLVVLEKLNLDNYNETVNHYQKEVGQDDNQRLSTIGNAIGIERNESEIAIESSTGPAVTELPGQSLGFDFERIQSADQFRVEEERGARDFEQSNLSTLTSDLGFDFEKIEEADQQSNESSITAETKDEQAVAVINKAEQKEESKAEAQENKESPRSTLGGDDSPSKPQKRRGRKSFVSKPLSEVSSAEELGEKAKFQANIKAIQLIKSGEPLSQEDRHILSLYSGWGGLSKAFFKTNGNPYAKWENEAAVLSTLLSEEEYKQARSSTLTSHYTPDSIVKAMWKGIIDMGFTGGKILEPSAGVGTFIKNMPNELKSGAEIDAVEIDSITSSILNGIYSDNSSVKVFNTGFQDFNQENGVYDLVIGNPPFGQISIHDSERKHLNGLSIHNYFFAKSLELMKENGLMVMVVSSYLMDAKQSRIREIIGKQANLVGAVRLPDSTFKKIADAEVTTDIIVLQKVPAGQQTNIDTWLDVGEVNGVAINKYYETHPQYLLGDWRMETGAYRESAQLIDDGRDIQAELAMSLEVIAENIHSSVASSVIEEPKTTVKENAENIQGQAPVDLDSIARTKRDGEHFIFEDKIYLAHKVRYTLSGEPANEPYTLVETKLNSKLEEVPLKETEIARLKGLIKVAEVTNALRTMQINELAEEHLIEAKRAELNAVYDEFVKKYGYLNSQTNKSLFREDVNSSLLLSLEKDFDKGVSAAQAKELGIKQRKPSAEKADIFTKRTQYPYFTPTSAETTQDALLISLSEKGRVDMGYIASLVSKEEDDVINELKREGLVFFDDFNNEFVTKESYLSGNVKRKFSQTAIAENKQALKEVFPADLSAADINVQLGASWVPQEYFVDFIKHITGDMSAKIHFHEYNSQWEVKANSTLDGKLQWGTERRTPDELIESLMNNRTIQVFDTSYDDAGKKIQVLNKGQTMLAIQKAEQISHEWKGWVYQEESRREEIERIYNELFNVYAQTSYDGSHMTLPGKVSDKIFELRPHQKNAVWRVMQSKNVLFDHTVGTGKTATAITSVMEMRRTGKAKKPIIVVPNHLVSQWGKEFMELYPNANILVPEKRDFEKKRRHILMNRIMTGDYDAVIIGHSQLIHIENDPLIEIEMVEREIRMLEDVIENSNRDMTVKRMEKRVANLKARMAALTDYNRDNINFSELGIDAIFVDEAHEFKNLTYQTAMSSVGGLGNPEGSKKAFDLYVKTESVLQKTGGQNIVFLTGTPISNSVAEMYTMQRYLARDELEAKRIANFDSWAKTFAEVVTDWELTATMKYKLKARLAKFNNMPELIAIYRDFADVITREMVQEQLKAQGKSLPVPKLMGDKPLNVVAERSYHQASFIGEELEDGSYTKGSLIHRAETGQDIMLKIISDARKCALDMRIIDPNAADHEGSKVNMAIEKAMELYHQWSHEKGVQLIFCDLSTPKGAISSECEKLIELIRLAENSENEEEREAAEKELSTYSQDDIDALMSAFSVYDDVRQKLIDLGVPASEIAFIHDANTDLKKQALFAKVNSGEVRFLLGSTTKMGAGMNVQERLVGLHHLDAPWRPSDLEQREGRIIRQGNKLVDKYDDFEVFIGRYATKATLDSMMWQIIETKARFIEQIRKGDMLDRQIEDLEGQSATAAEMKAASSGNPLILEEMKVRQDIKKLETIRESIMRQSWNIERSIKNKQEYIESFDQRESLIQKDVNRIHEMARENFIQDQIKARSTEEKKVTREEVLEGIDVKEIRNIDMEHFRVVYDGKIYTNEDRELFGHLMVKKLSEMSDDSDCVFGNYYGFDIVLERVSRYQMYITLVGESEYQAERPILGISDATPLGLTARVVNQVNKIESKLNQDRLYCEKCLSDIPVLKKNLEANVFAEEEKLEELRVRHQVILNALQDGLTSLDDESVIDMKR